MPSSTLLLPLLTPLTRNAYLPVAITVVLALDNNVGATGKKAFLRALGTLAGGAGGAALVALTSFISSYTPKSADPAENYWRRVLISALVFLCVAVLR